MHNLLTDSQFTGCGYTRGRTWIGYLQLDISKPPKCPLSILLITFLLALHYLPITVLFTLLSCLILLQIRLIELIFTAFLLNFQALFCGPLPGALQRVGACLAAILRAAECPVCGGSVRPPALQCPRGHLLCARCRPRLPACPLCRAPLVPNATRNLLADEVSHLSSIPTLN